MKFRYFSFIAAASVLAMASCTDDGPNEGNNPENPDGPSAGVQSLGNVPVNVYTDLDKFGGSIYNYNPFVGGSRAGESLPTFEMEDFKGIPEGLEELTENCYANSKDGVIRKKGSYEFQNSGANVIYIDAPDVNIKTYNGNGITFYIAPGASASFGWVNGVNIYAYGSVAIDGIDNSHVYIKGDFGNKDAEFTMSNDCSLNVEGNVVFAKLNHNKGNISAGTFTHYGDLSLTNDIKLSVAATTKINGNFTFNTNGKLCTKCLDVTKDLTVANYGGFKIRETLHADNLEITAGGTIYLNSSTFVNIENDIKFGNTNCQFNATGNKHPAFILAKAIYGNMDEGNDKRSIMSFFNGNIIIDEKTILYNSNKSNEVVNRNGVENSYIFVSPEGVNFATVKPKNLEDGCAGASSPNPKPVPPVIPEPIGGIDVDHTHPISATCVALGGNNQFFLSWHKRGAGQVEADHAIHGCIETLTYDVQNNQIVLDAWMETATAGNIGGMDVDYEPIDNAYDFNHIIYHNNMLYGVGDHPKKGGFIAKINLPYINNFLPDNYDDIMVARELMDGNAMSGNSLVVNGNDLYITSAGGYQIGNFDIFEKEDDKVEGIGEKDWHWKGKFGKSMTTNGSAKHVAMNGNYVATIEYTQRPGVDYDENDVTTALPAKITMWNANDWLGSSVWTADVPAFAPIYGKDVIAVDNDGTVYSCQGREGVGVYQNGQQIGRFKISEWYKEYNAVNDIKFEFTKKFETSAANGLYIAGDYLFVAYGGAGVYVLDKNTLEVLSWYDTGGSANFVQVRDGIAYIAYGTAGAQVVNFKLDELQK